MGPDRRGRCQGAFECVPANKNGKWQCRRPASQGGLCKEGPNSDGSCCHVIPPCRPRRSLRSARGAVSAWSALLAIGLLSLALTYAGDAEILIPGPLSSGHSPVGSCDGCHTGIRQGSFGWLHALVSPSSLQDDTKTCIACHKITPEALQPHGQAVDQLAALTKRARETEAARQMPLTAMVRDLAFPTDAVFADGVFCATCHKEHQGRTANLSDVSSGRCHACHAVQFDSFESGHPQFSSYPYTRRTRINFDHASHFGEHFGKTRAKNDEGFPIPGTCADCHQPAADKMRMDVKPFKEVCSACHLHQIAGTERLSSHQGIAFLSLPGLDVETLEARGAAPGAWPRGSEAKLSPFMALLIGRDRDSQAALKVIGDLNLQDLSDAADNEIAAVNWLVWEIKTLLYALSTKTPSEALQKLAANGAEVDADMLGRLTAHLPRDVVTSAIREWMPALEVEIAEHQPVAPPSATTVKASTDDTFRIWISETNRTLEEGARVPDPTRVSEFGKTPSDDEPELEAEGEDDASDILSDDEIEAAEDESLEEESADDESLEEEVADDESEILSGDEDLDEEEGEDAEAEELAEEEDQPEQQDTTPLDAQSWAELGGWYRQDFSLLYKPTGHADRFFQTWLNHTASLLGDARISEPVFAALIDERAQGQCTKCHSVDAKANGERVINWGPATTESMEGRFTVFAHEPHFGFTDNKGCLTCHQLDQTAPYQKGFEDHDPSTFVANFKPMTMDQCTSCHNDNSAATTCLTCHEYHVNDVKTPVMNTKVPE